MGYTTSGIKMVPLAKKGSTNYVEATPANAVNGTYPLTRYLFVYVNKKPNQPLAPLDGEFIKMVLSKTGQQVVIKDGYIPLPAKVVEKELAKLK
jgi:phosphate transport system substrate-binding protein